MAQAQELALAPAQVLDQALAQEWAQALVTTAQALAQEWAQALVTTAQALAQENALVWVEMVPTQAQVQTESQGSHMGCSYIKHPSLTVTTQSWLLVSTEGSSCPQKAHSQSLVVSAIQLLKVTSLHLLYRYVAISV